MINIYLLLSLILVSALCVITSKNIVQSVLYLILVFFLCSLLLIYLGADFIGLILLIVYIGAIAVLFLFVVMMLNIRILEISSSTFSINLFLAFFLSFIFFCLLLFIYWKNYYMIDLNSMVIYINWSIFNNIKMVAIGQLLFNDNFILFIGATLLLFVAMIGVIILTLHKKDIVNYHYRVTSKNINWKYK